MLLASHDLLFLGGVFSALLVIGFMYGAQIVSEVGLSIMLGSFLHSLIPISYFPRAAADILSPLLVSVELFAFAVLSGFGWWVMRNTSSTSLDFTPRMSKVIMGSFGTLGIVLFAVTRVVSIGQWYTFGALVTTIAGSQERILVVLIVSLVLVALSRKV